VEDLDRRRALGLVGAAGLAWIIVLAVLSRLDPTADPVNAYAGELAIGAAVGLMVGWLGTILLFGRHRRIAYRGDWTRAARRGGWVAIVAAAFVILRLQQVFQLSIALFILALVVLAEVTLSVER